MTQERLHRKCRTLEGRVLLLLLLLLFSSGCFVAPSGLAALTEPAINTLDTYVSFDVTVDLNTTTNFTDLFIDPNTQVQSMNRASSLPTESFHVEAGYDVLDQLIFLRACSATSSAILRMHAAGGPLSHIRRSPMRVSAAARSSPFSWMISIPPSSAPTSPIR